MLRILRTNEKIHGYHSLKHWLVQHYIRDYPIEFAAITESVKRQNHILHSIFELLTTLRSKVKYFAFNVKNKSGNYQSTNSS